MISLRSEVTRKLLNYFFLNPQESLYVNEMSRKLGLDKRNLVKKLKELENESILKSQNRGNLKLYSINEKYPLYDEYKKIISKTIGLEKKLRDVLGKIKEIKEAYIYGSYAKNEMDTHSDIDLLVIGEHSVLSLQREINTIQKEADREINVVNMGQKEFKNRIQKKDPFIKTIFKQKYIKII